jgi:epoxyqueuosine reductase QueG
MNPLTAQSIKQRATELGAALCGIAPVESFSQAPAGFHPTDVLPGCQSVIVTAAPFPRTTIATGTSQAAYTFVRHRVMEKMDRLTFLLAEELETAGVAASPIPSSDPYESWDPERRHGQGILSLKHAAVLAGLGKMGKNTLLVNQRFGNLLWLGAVLVDAPLAADPVADYCTCPDSCRICLNACPAHALDGVSIEQKKCREISGKFSDGGGYVLACNLCRKVCPNMQGLR